VDPDQVLNQAGIDRRIFEEPLARLPIPHIGRLLAACVRATGMPHFGLLAGSQFELQMLGPLGYVIRNEASVRSALRALVLHLHLQDRGSVASLTQLDVRLAGLSYAVCTPGTPAVDLIDDTAMMIGLRIMKTICGRDWKPVEVRLAHKPPSDRRIYRELFGTRVRFDAPLSMLVFEQRWLDDSIPGADPALLALINQLLAALEEKSNTSLGEKVRRVLRTSVLAGTANAGSLAELLSLSERSLRRHLAREGLKLQDLINEARLLVAQQLIEQTRLSLRDIADALAYSDLSALSRAFRGWTGIAPSQWRRVHNGLVPRSG
jgi:AraC-like DNA-binding protein